MRIAVVGAGIAGVSTAYELAVAGHTVSLYDRRDGIAEGASFGHAGLLSSGLVSPARAPGLRQWLVRGVGTRDAALHWSPSLSPALWRWLWRWWRSGRHPQPADLQALVDLARLSAQRRAQIGAALGIAYERSRGALVVLRHDRQLLEAEPQLRMLRAMGVPCEPLSAARCREIEPGLAADAPIAGGIGLPDDGVGNCRAWAQQLRDAAVERHGLQLRLGHGVAALRHHGDGVELVSAQPTSRSVSPSAPGAATRPGPGWYEAVVLCTGADSPELIAQAGVALPLRAVWGQSLTLPLHPEGIPLRSAVVDVAAGVTLTRLGNRLRVSGGHRLGTSATEPPPAHLARRDLERLYHALDHWLPASVGRHGAVHWLGARPMLPEGPPVIGPATRPRVWLYLGAGAHGWTLASGGAQLLAQMISEQPTALDPEPYAIDRWCDRRSH